MKYILVLGIEYKKYKKPAKVSLHIGNRFIDLFDLENDYTNISHIFAQKGDRWFENFCVPIMPRSHEWAKEYTKIVPEFYKIYEIDDEELYGFLEINVENSNSDYTNGFMKHTSLIKLSIVCLFPKVLANNKAENLRKVISKLNTYVDNYRKRKKNKLTPDWLPKNKWPIAESFVDVRYDDSQKKNEVKNNFWWIGGSFTARFPIRTKHKIKYLGSSKHKDQGYVNARDDQNLIISSYKPLLNIYNEDQ